MSLQWIRVDDYEAMSAAGAARIAAALEPGLRQSRPVLLGLATGNTMLVLYQRLAELLNQRGLDLSQLHTFNLDEYVGADGRWVPTDHPLSYHAYMEKNFFARLDPKLGMKRDHIHFPDPACPAALDDLIQRLGGLDLQLLGIGFNGHIAFNEPMSEAEIGVEAFAALPTRVIDLTELTIDTNARLTAGGDRSQGAAPGRDAGHEADPRRPRDPAAGLLPRAAGTAGAECCAAVPRPNCRPATCWIIPIARSSTRATGSRLEERR